MSSATVSPAAPPGAQPPPAPVSFEGFLASRGRTDAVCYRRDDEGHYQRGSVETDSTDRSVVLPGFRLRMEWLWQQSLPDPATVACEFGLEAGAAEDDRRALGIEAAAGNRRQSSCQAQRTPVPNLLREAGSGQGYAQAATRRLCLMLVPAVYCRLTFGKQA